MCRQLRFCVVRVLLLRAVRMSGPGARQARLAREAGLLPHIILPAYVKFLWAGGGLNIFVVNDAAHDKCILRKASAASVAQLACVPVCSFLRFTLAAAGKPPYCPCRPLKLPQPSLSDPVPHVPLPQNGASPPQKAKSKMRRSDTASVLNAVLGQQQVTDLGFLQRLSDRLSRQAPRTAQPPFRTPVAASAHGLAGHQCSSIRRTLSSTSSASVCPSHSLQSHPQVQGALSPVSVWCPAVWG